MIKTFPNVNRNKFHTELQNAGILPKYVFAIDDTDIGCKIIFPENVDMYLIEAVLNAHDPTPSPPKPTQENFLLDLDYRLSVLELGL